MGEDETDLTPTHTTPPTPQLRNSAIVRNNGDDGDSGVKAYKTIMKPLILSGDSALNQASEG